MYTDIVVANDQLIVKIDGVLKVAHVGGFTIKNGRDAFVDGHKYKVNTRGWRGRVFVGNFPVIARR